MGHDKDGDVPELVPEFRLDPHWEDAQKLLNLGQVFVIVIFVLGLLLQLLILVSGNLFVLGRADLLPNFEDVVELNLEFVDKKVEMIFPFVVDRPDQLPLLPPSGRKPVAVKPLLQTAPPPRLRDRLSQSSAQSPGPHA